MQQDDTVTSSTEEHTLPAPEWDYPILEREGYDSTRVVNTGGLPDRVPHFVIQKKFYDEADYLAAVKTVGEGSRFDSIWHYCPARNCNWVGIGREGSEIDPRTGLSGEKVRSLIEKHGLKRELQVISNHSPALIRSERKELEVNYPLYYWMVIRRDDEVVDSESCLMTDHILDMFPTLIPHARKVLGRATRQVLAYQWQCMRDLGEKLEDLQANTKSMTFIENGRVLAVFRLSVVYAPMTGDPIVLTSYDLDDMCDGTTCSTFARSGCMEMGDWIFSYSY